MHHTYSSHLTTFSKNITIALLVFIGCGIQSKQANADVIDLTVGTGQVCYLDESYQLRCRTRNERVVPPDDTPQLVSIAAGDTHFCGLTASGLVHCFGDNNFGQTSHESVTQGTQYKGINAGGNHTCAIRSSGLRIDCWGGESSQLNTTLSEYLREIFSGDVQDISRLVMGTHNICWVAENTRDRTDFICWENGRDFYHILATNNITSASSDGDYYCSVRGTGSVGCGLDIGWRRTSHSLSFDLPAPYAKVAASGNVICVLDTDGRLDCDTSVLDSEPQSPFDAGHAPLINEQVSLLSDRRFTQLEPYPAFFGRRGVGFCLTDTQDKLLCIGPEYESLDDSGPSADWIDTGFTANDYFNSSDPLVQSRDALTNITDVSVYAHNIVELFWEPMVSSVEYSHVEIYRDGLLLTNTNNGNSYFDSTLEGSTTYSYQIREINLDGTAGERDMYDADIGVLYNLFINGTQINTAAFDNNGSYYLFREGFLEDTNQFSINAVDSCGRVSGMSNAMSVGL